MAFIFKQWLSHEFDKKFFKTFNININQNVNNNQNKQGKKKKSHHMWKKNPDLFFFLQFCKR